MTPQVEAAHHALGILDVVCAFFLIWATQRTTANAGLHSSDARWALWRRAVYLSMSIALFGLGLKRFFDDTDDVLYAVFQSVVLLGVMNFIVLRALGYITQDVFTNGSRTRIRQ